MKAILTIGVSASGKTTWAETHVRDMNAFGNDDWVNICRDDIRWRMIGVRRKYIEEHSKMIHLSVTNIMFSQ